MKKPLKLTLITVFAIAAILFITEWILSQTYVMPEMSKRTKIFNRGDVDDVREFLQQPYSEVEMDNYYALINRNRPDILEMMFKEFKLDPDYGFRYEYATPLFGAAKELKPEVVSVLVKYGADVNYKDPYGMTPLIAASYTTFERENSASLEITKMLVKAGADVNAASNIGRSALSGALAGTHDDLERAKYLIENGADSNLVDNDNMSYMFYCNSIECYEYFLSKGIDINSIDKSGENILQDSLYAGFDIDKSNWLLEQGANICHKDNNKDIILDYADKQGLGLHRNQKDSEFYQNKVKENRSSEMYKFLENEYNKKCIDNQPIQAENN